MPDNIPADQTPAAPPVETPVDRGPARSSLDVDGLVEKFFGPDDAAAPPATPKAKSETPDPEADTPVDQQDPVDEIEDTDDEPAGGEETGEDEELEDLDEPPLEDDEDAEVEALLAETEEDVDVEDEKDTSKESFLPEFDRVKFLKENPELEKPYKHMQAAFSRKMAEVAKVRAKAEDETSTAQTMQRQHEAFLEKLKNDDSFEEFLVQVSLNRPEVMEKAYERAVALTEDEGKKKEYLRDKELEETKGKLKEKEEREQAEFRQRRTVEIVNLTQRVASKLGLTGEGDLEVAEQYVANQILQNHANDGKRDITPAQIVTAVRRAQKALSREKENVRKTTKAEVKKKSLDAARDRARAPKRPAPPKGGKAPAAQPKTPSRVDNRPKQAPLDAWLDEQLGVEV